MKDYSAATYGEQIAEVYDQMYPNLDQAIIPTMVEDQMVVARYNSVSVQDG